METIFSLFLTKEREKQGISQERLCRGLCAVSALSRYENGERVPDRLLMNALIQRLGKSSDQLTTMISCQEYAYFEWKRKVKEALRKKNISLAQELLQKKEALDGAVNATLQEQFYRYIQGILKGTYADISDLEEAIRLTHPEFSGKIEEEDLFSIQELNLLLFYAKCKMQRDSAFICTASDGNAGRTGCQIAGRCSKLYSGTYDGYSGKKSDLSKSCFYLLPGSKGKAVF